MLKGALQRAVSSAVLQQRSVGLGVVRALSAAAPASAATASKADSYDLKDLLPTRRRQTVVRGQQIKNYPVHELPLVATHTVHRTTGISPPGRPSPHEEVDVLHSSSSSSARSGGESAASSEGEHAGSKQGVRFATTTTTASSDSANEESLSSNAASSSSRSSSDSEGDLAPSSSASPRALHKQQASSSFPIPDRLFAVISLGGTQYKVTEGDVINAEYMPSVSVGDTVTLGQGAEAGTLAAAAEGEAEAEAAAKQGSVNLVGSAERSILGRPSVPGASVRLLVEEHTQSKKVIVFKMRRRKRYMRQAGHRRIVTRLRVMGIHCSMQDY